MLRNCFPVFVALLFSTGVWAQAPGPGAPSTSPPVNDIFAQLDANGDGVISQEEAQAEPVVAEHFDAADTNGDGGLSRVEFEAGFTPQPPPGGPPTGGF